METAPPATDAPAVAPDGAVPVDTGGPSAGRAVSDIVLQIVGRLVNGAMGAVVLVILTRELGEAEFGVWTTLTTVIFLGGAVTDLGFTTVAIRHAAVSDRDAPGWVGTLLVVRCVTSVVAAIACALAAAALDRGHGMVLAGALLSLVVLFGGFSALTVAFQLRVRNDLTIVVMTVGSVLWTGGAAAAAILHLHLVGFAIVFTAANLLTTAFGARLALRHMTVSFEDLGGRVRTFVRVGLPLSISTLRIYSYGRGDQILGFKLAGESSAGLYGAAYRILDQATVIPLSVITTLYPLIVRALTGARHEWHRIVQPAFESLWALSMGALVVAVLCGGPLMGIVFGKPFHATGPTLAVLMGAYVVISLNYLIGCFILIFDLQRFAGIVSLGALVFNVAFNLVFIPRWGYLAAAVATVATELLVLLLNGRRVLRAMRFHPRLGAATRTLLAAFVSIAALEPLRRAGIPAMALFALSLSVYFGLLIMVRGIDVRALTALVRNRRLAT